MKKKCFIREYNHTELLDIMVSDKRTAITDDIIAYEYSDILYRIIVICNYKLNKSLRIETKYNEPIENMIDKFMGNVYLVPEDIRLTYNMSKMNKRNFLYKLKLCKDNIKGIVTESTISIDGEVITYSIILEILVGVIILLSTLAAQGLMR